MKNTIKRFWISIGIGFVSWFLTDLICPEMIVPSMFIMLVSLVYLNQEK